MAAKAAEEPDPYIDRGRLPPIPNPAHARWKVEMDQLRALLADAEGALRVAETRVAVTAGGLARARLEAASARTAAEAARAQAEVLRVSRPAALGRAQAARDQLARVEAWIAAITGSATPGALEQTVQDLLALLGAREEDQAAATDAEREASDAAWRKARVADELGAELAATDTRLEQLAADMPGLAAASAAAQAAVDDCIASPPWDDL